MPNSPRSLTRVQPAAPPARIAPTREPSWTKSCDCTLPAGCSPGSPTSRPPCAYLPFSLGARHCIGETLALSEMLFHLRKVVPHYRLIHVPDKPIELEAQINLRTRRPVMMRIEPR